MILKSLEKLHQVNACADELASLGPDTEPEFLNIGETLNKLATICFGMPGGFSCKLTQTDSFTNIWYKYNSPIDFTLLHGKLFPFWGSQKAFNFFGIEDEDNSSTANKTKEAVK